MRFFNSMIAVTPAVLATMSISCNTPDAVSSAAPRPISRASETDHEGNRDVQRSRNLRSNPSSGSCSRGARGHSWRTNEKQPLRNARVDSQGWDSGRMGMYLPRGRVFRNDEGRATTSEAESRPHLHLGRHGGNPVERDRRGAPRVTGRLRLARSRGCHASAVVADQVPLLLRKRFVEQPAVVGRRLGAGGRSTGNPGTDRTVSRCPSLSSMRSRTRSTPTDTLPSTSSRPPPPPRAV